MYISCTINIISEVDKFESRYNFDLHFTILWFCLYYFFFRIELTSFSFLLFRGMSMEII